jgi:uncharacterized membrane protein
LNSEVAKLKKPTLLIVLLLLQLALAFSFIFNIRAARAVLGFLYVSVLPGITIVGLFNPKIERVEKMLFAVGVSIVFFMVIGVFLNFFGPIFGILNPLGTMPIFITSIIIDVFATYRWINSCNHVEYSDLAAEPKTRKLSLLVPLLILLPLLSIIGALQVSVRYQANNSLLLIIPLVVSALVILTAFYKKLHSEVYASILFSIALAMLLQFSIFSPYLVGGDIFGEYAALSSTLQHSFWNVQVLNRLNAMLSVTVLPTIYANILGLNGTWVFKLIYPLIFALVPVGVYQLFKSQMTKQIAFISVFFFMSSLTFFQELPELPRQMIGELFYILLFLTILKKDLQPSVRIAFFTIFSFGIICSHYAMAYIFLGYIVASWLFYLVSKRRSPVSLGMIAIFATLLFSWYIYTASGATFGDLTNTLQVLQQNFSSDFFNAQSRGSMTLQGLGVNSDLTKTLLQQIGQYSFITSELLIIIGFLTLAVKNRVKFFKNDFNFFAFCSLMLLVACVVVPNFANTFNVQRFYHIAVFFLAPFCIIGGLFVLTILARKKIKEKNLLKIIVLVVLIPVFLFQSGFLYEITKQQSYALPLSSYRLDSLQFSYQGILRSSEVSGAQWLAQANNLEFPIFTDPLTVIALCSANIQPSQFQFLSLGSKESSGSIIYLAQYSVPGGVVFDRSGMIVNTTQVIPQQDSLNTIYSSDSCIIYQIP